MDRPSPRFKISDDKLSITTISTIASEDDTSFKYEQGYGTIQFGQFLKATDKFNLYCCFSYEENM